MRKVNFILLLVFFAITGCSVAKKASRSGYIKEPVDKSSGTVESIVKNNLSNSSFLIQKADISVSEDGLKSRFLASLKYKSPDSLLITVKSKIGIELGRLFLTKDTLFILDRINKKLMTGKPEVIKTKYGIDRAILFVAFGDLIIDKKDFGKVIKCNKGLFKSDFLLGEQSIDYEIDCKNRKVKSAYIEGDLHSGNIVISFTDFKELNNAYFPGSVEIYNDMSSLKISIDIEKVETDWKGKVGFNPDNGYKVVYLK